jgi:hypothetical protein
VRRQIDLNDDEAYRGEKRQSKKACGVGLGVGGWVGAASTSLGVSGFNGIEEDCPFFNQATVHGTFRVPPLRNLQA